MTYKLVLEILQTPTGVVSFLFVGYLVGTFSTKLFSYLGSEKREKAALEKWKLQQAEQTQRNGDLIEKNGVHIDKLARTVELHINNTPIHKDAGFFVSENRCLERHDNTKKSIGILFNKTDALERRRANGG